MPMPTEFVNQVVRLQQTSDQNAKATSLPGLEPRDWMLPAFASTEGLDLQNPTFLKHALDRSLTTTLYIETLQRDLCDGLCGSAGELVAYKSGVDYLGACERALQARHTSRSRALRWAAARRFGHGDAVYGAFITVLNDLNSTLGAAGPQPPG